MVIAFNTDTIIAIIFLSLSYLTFRTGTWMLAHSKRHYGTVMIPVILACALIEFLLSLVSAACVLGLTGVFN